MAHAWNESCVRFPVPTGFATTELGAVSSQGYLALARERIVEAVDFELHLLGAHDRLVRVKK